MREIVAESAVEYLRETGRIPPGRTAAVRELAGGVSNIVLRVDVEGEGPFVIKQCRERLRVAMDWRAPLERIWTEREALGLLERILPTGQVPGVLFEDRPNYLFAMTCAPDDAVTWKSRLMDGEADSAIAHDVGAMLGAIHAIPPDQPTLAGPLADARLFDELRVDPYYRTTARSHPDLAPAFEALIEEMRRTPDPTFVHGDFSPKNLLVHAGGVVLLDFECTHRGDPAFDIGFFLSHLLLKAFRASPDHGAYLAVIDAFADAYHAAARPDAFRYARGARHAAACTLARLDGKSPVDYRHDLDEAAVRRFARAALLAEPPDMAALLDLAAQEMRRP